MTADYIHKLCLSNTQNVVSIADEYMYVERMISWEMVYEMYVGRNGRPRFAGFRRNELSFLGSQKPPSIR